MLLTAVGALKVTPAALCAADFGSPMAENVLILIAMATKAVAKLTEEIPSEATLLEVGGRV